MKKVHFGLIAWVLILANIFVFKLHAEDLSYSIARYKIYNLQDNCTKMNPKEINKIVSELDSNSRLLINQYEIGENQDKEFITVVTDSKTVVGNQEKYILLYIFSDLGMCEEFKSNSRFYAEKLFKWGF